MAKTVKVPPPPADWETLWESSLRKQNGIILRSPVSRGKILGYTYPPIPDGVTLILPEHIPGNNYYAVLKSRFPFLAEERINYKGEPVGLASSSDFGALHTWSKGFKVVAAEETPHFDPLTSPEVFKLRSLNWGEELPPEEGDWILERNYTSGAQDAGDFESLGVKVLSQDKKIWVHGPTQWPRNLLEGISRVLGREKEEIFLSTQAHMAPMDSRLWYPGWLASAAALLMHTSGHPVRLDLHKKDEFSFLPKKPETHFHFTSTHRVDGTLKALKVQVILDAGAYGLMDGEILDRIVLGLGAVYQFPYLEVEAQSVMTNTPPRGPLGSWGEDIGQIALELFLGEMCKAVKIDPVFWKIQNFTAPHSAFFTGDHLRETPPFFKILEELARNTDYHRKFASNMALSQKVLKSSDHRYRRGIGMSMGFTGNGFIASGTAPATLALTLEAHGKLTIASTLAPWDEVQKDHWKALASATLGINPKDVHISPWIRGDSPDGGPSTLGRRFMLGEKLLEQCLTVLVQKRAAGKFPLQVEKTFRRAKHLSWNSEDFHGVPFVSFTWGGAVAEIQWDRIFSQIKVTKITLVMDGGQIHDEQRARRAVLSSLRSALGWSLVEKVKWDPVSTSFRDYASYRLIHTLEMPEVQLIFLPSTTKSTRKALGSLPWSLVPGAILTAIAQATGNTLTAWPLSRKDLPEGVHDN